VRGGGKVGKHRVQNKNLLITSMQYKCRAVCKVYVWGPSLAVMGSIGSQLNPLNDATSLEPQTTATSNL
jgi:hypothetical protein